MVAEGYEVVGVAPNDKYAQCLADLGCRFIPMPMDNHGTDPGKDGVLLVNLFKLLRFERPDIFLGYTIKPNIYGSLTAHALGIPVINNIAGLGIVFGNTGVLEKLVRLLYYMALSRSAKVFFQNKDDRKLFQDWKLVSADVTDLLPGSGIDLKKFRVLPPRTLENKNHNFRFLLIARMLWDKGVDEYVQAFKLVRERWPNIECCLLGFLDALNPSAISQSQMDDLVAQGVIYLGTSDDVRAEIAEADCIVLPSYYREGTPRSLLEAAAMARPIITTDAVGCREVVDDGVNGYLCKVRDVGDLAEKMEMMLSLSSNERTAMGLQGRKKMEVEFDEQLVINKYLAAINAVLNR